MHKAIFTEILELLSIRLGSEGSARHGNGIFLHQYNRFSRRDYCSHVEMVVSFVPT